jgi:hypothetical protein
MRRNRWIVISMVTLVVLAALGYWAFVDLEAGPPESAHVEVASRRPSQSQLVPLSPAPSAPAIVTPRPVAKLADDAGPRPSPSPIVAHQVVPPIVVPTAAPIGAEWLPPAPTDRVFDLDGNGRVQPNEQERAAELLERAHQFASNRSSDGTYPILKAGFRGEGKLFRAIDVDADGALSEREFLAFEVDSIRQLRRFDQNADGALTLDEFGHLATRFDFLDEDKDGLLYAWEITLMRGRGKW